MIRPELIHHIQIDGVSYCQCHIPIELGLLERHKVPSAIRSYYQTCHQNGRECAEQTIEFIRPYYPEGTVFTVVKGKCKQWGLDDASLWED